MDSNLKTRWISELRSGKYNQGMFRLKTKNNDDFCEHCCLGVLAEILAVDGACKISERNGLYYFDFECFLTSGIQGFLPLQILSDDLQGKLTTMNDHERRTFTEIADWIEENL